MLQGFVLLMERAQLLCLFAGICVLAAIAVLCVCWSELALVGLHLFCWRVCFLRAWYAGHRQGICAQDGVGVYGHFASF